jgi:hypothetical protein
MNKQLREFEQASGLEIYGLGAKRDQWERAMEQFARLVALEAIAVVQKRFMGDLNREDMEVRQCVEDLKQHFGVEL